MVVAGSLELAVLKLPAGSDPDSLLRQEGPDAFRQRIDRASHWFHWELEELLAPARTAPEDLAVLQRCERQAAALLALLPIGPLRRRAEERLHQQLGAVPRVAAPASPAMESELASPGEEAVMRAERRALRLFLASPASRPALVGLALQTPLHRRALECLQLLHQRLPEGEETLEPEDLLPAAVLDLAPRLDPELGGLLVELSQCGNRVRQLLAEDPQPKLMAVLDVLEPVGSKM